MNVVGYFKTIELLLSDNGVTSEHSKYASLVTALSKDKSALSKVTDILQQLVRRSISYSQLKTALLGLYSSEQGESPHSLLYSAVAAQLWAPPKKNFQGPQYLAFDMNCFRFFQG